VLLALAVPLTGCGSNLLVVRRTAVVVSGERTVPATITYRPEHGLAHADAPAARWLLGLLIEPIDWVASTTVAVGSIFSAEDYIAHGPIGWLWTLTPFATAIPAIELPPRTSVSVDADQLARLQTGDLDTARAVFGDARLQAIELTR
jgi:hypothetical protein